MIQRGCESVGIDLGTTYSSLACMDAQGTPQIVSDTSGQIATPSVIYFDDQGVVVGDLALQQSKVSAERVVQFVKVHMGDQWQVERLGHTYTPESLSAIILRHLVHETEPQIGRVYSAVITVPAYFTERRRRATEQAGSIAGLEVIGTLNEPMAATLSYGLYRNQGEQKVVVYDLGGGTFDVTVVHIGPREICELATCGNRKLGGRDWDQALFDFVADDFQKAHKVDLREDLLAVQELQLECERAKRNLSRVSQISMRVHAAKRSHIVQITRRQFEELTAKLLHSTRLTTEMALEDAELNWTDVSRVVLVGGSTQMPAVRKMLEEISGSPPDLGVHPVTSVALGAAVYAHMLETGTAPLAIQQASPAADDFGENGESDEASEDDPDDLLTVECIVEDDEADDEAVEPLRVVAAQADSNPDFELSAPTGFARTPLPEDDAPVPEDDAIASAEPAPAVRFVTAHGVGIRTLNQGLWRNRVLIPKNSAVPIEVTKRFVTQTTGGRGSHINVLVTQGDTPDIELAEVLGKGQIRGFPVERSVGQPVDVIMRFDEFGRLHIRAVYVPTGMEMQMSLEIPHGLTEQQVRTQREHLKETPMLTVFRPDAESEQALDADDDEVFVDLSMDDVCDDDFADYEDDYDDDDSFSLSAE